MFLDKRLIIEDRETVEESDWRDNERWGTILCNKKLIWRVEHCQKGFRGLDHQVFCKRGSTTNH